MYALTHAGSEPVPPPLPDAEVDADVAALRRASALLEACAEARCARVHALLLRVYVYVPLTRALASSGPGAA